MDFSRYVAFCLSASLLIVVPGPSVLFVIGRSVSYGRRAGVLTAIGNEIGVLVQVAFVAAGLGSVVERSQVVFNVVKSVGALYLVWLGIQTIRHRREAADVGVTHAATAPLSGARIVRQGLVVGVANPKALVFLAAVLPQFVNRSAGRTPVQMLVLGATFAAIALVSDSVWALVAGTARAWFKRSPRRLEAVSAAGGAVAVGLGVRLALTRRH